MYSWRSALYISKVLNVQALKARIRLSVDSQSVVKTSLTEADGLTRQDCTMRWACLAEKCYYLK